MVRFGYIPDKDGLYRPHLTVIRFSDEKIAERAARKIVLPGSFEAACLSVFEAGPSGTCKKRVARYSFKS